jgi:putative OPT family oligopeptide transporter
VGFIVGLNIAVLVFLGGAISWYIAIPIYSTLFLERDPSLLANYAAGMSAADLAFSIWTSKIRYLGVGAMLIGGIWALVSMRGSLISGITSGLKPQNVRADTIYNHAQHDAPMKLVLWGIALLIIPIFFLYQVIVGMLGVALAMTFIMMITGFLFSSVAAYMAGLVGSSNNPISGITIATILFTSFLLVWLMGGDAEVGPAAAIMVGAVVCCAAAIAGDNMQDLKAGYLVGATPWRQQLMQGVGVVSAVLVIAPILNLLLEAYGIGAPTAARPNALLAPQATLMASVAEGVFGSGLPWDMVIMGSIIGIVIIILDETLKARKSSWRAPVLAVAVGIYLPLQLSTAILVGGLVAHFAKRNRQAKVDDQTAFRNGTLVASGLITGEALVGIFIAVPIVVTGNPDVIRLSVELPSGIGLIVIAALVAYLYKVATRGGASG